MIVNKIRYGRAIQRNIWEIYQSLSYRNAHVKFQSIISLSDWSYFSYANSALYDGIFFHAIKVFDKHKESASFFYIRNCNKAIVDNELDRQELTIEQIETVSAKLKTIRDLTHFHNDKKYVVDPQEAWNKAALTGSHLSKVSDKLWKVLNALHVLHFNRPSGHILYDAADIQNVINVVTKGGIIL